ncbi:membrane protein [Peptococcaceae bacterium SCADC1_2_3]|nr:membrane protein [Peptococcaceae bacterium SCADC1_2_3]KFI37396.1 membrane protein [Peptococcaceae bacterium SCADC1_2_3]HBQ28704.1 metal ABC transporter permease [Desulfotomaculum sp.]
MLEVFQYDFMRNATIAGLLAAVACGIIGSYVVLKRMVFISGGISHASFGGIGLGYFLGINPVLGALIFTVISSIGMGLLTKKTRLPEDTVIGILWAMGMALGIIFIDLTPGYTPDLFSYLFGNILLVSFFDLIIMLALNLIIVSTILLLFKEFLAISFDEEFAKVRGLPTTYLYLIMLCLIALTVVILIKIVGIILVIALLTIPASIARQFTYNLKKMMFIAIFLGVIFSFGGLLFSYILDLASGATTILLSGLAFMISRGIFKLRYFIIK